MSPEDWGRAYWAVFRGWSDATETRPETDINRLVRLWEWRLSELAQRPDVAETSVEAKAMRWLFQTPYISDADRVRLGAATARLAQGKLELHGQWERLRALAEVDLTGTFEIAEAVLLAHATAEYPYVPVEDVQPVLCYALENGNAAIKDRARHVINKLGERGYRQLKPLLGEAE